MNGNFVGQGQNSKENYISTSGGTSLAVQQFCAVAFGWMPVHRPSQPWRVERVAGEQRYCLKCFGERTFDVIEGTPLPLTPLPLTPLPSASPQMEERNLGGEGRRRKAAICRCCGEEQTL